jgi:hypothetical protein
MQKELAYKLCIGIIFIGLMRVYWCVVVDKKKKCLKNVNKPSTSSDGTKLSILICFSLIIIILLLRDPVCTK